MLIRVFLTYLLNFVSTIPQNKQNKFVRPRNDDATKTNSNPNKSQGNKRTITINSPTVLSQEIPKAPLKEGEPSIQCYNCRDWGNLARDCTKPSKTGTIKMLGEDQPQLDETRHASYYDADHAELEQPIKGVSKRSPPERVTRNSLENLQTSLTKARHKPPWFPSPIIRKPPTLHLPVSSSVVTSTS